MKSTSGKKYRLTIVYTFHSLNDISARKDAEIFLDSAILPIDEIKLQEIFDDKKPRKISMKNKP